MYEIKHLQSHEEPQDKTLSSLYLNLGSALIIKEPPAQPWDRGETALTPAVAAETGRDWGSPKFPQMSPGGTHVRLALGLMFLLVPLPSRLRAFPTRKLPVPVS